MSALIIPLYENNDHANAIVVDLHPDVIDRINQLRKVAAENQCVCETELVEKMRPIWSQKDCLLELDAIEHAPSTHPSLGFSVNSVKVSEHKLTFAVTDQGKTYQTVDYWYDSIIR